MKKIAFIVNFLFISFLLLAQKSTIEIVSTGTNTSLRGLSVVNDNVAWVSGSNGTVGRTANGGKNWKWFIVKGFEQTEFRDIEGFNADVALIMSVAEPAYILKTINGGENWKVVYENKTKGMFLDAMDFANNRMGVVIGDPINGKIFMARTDDTGNTWQEVAEERQAADSGEAFFAASGSNIKFFASKDYFMVSGGLHSRLINNKSAIDLPIIHGKESTGANSIDIFDNGRPDKPGNRMVIVGGDFLADTSSEKNCLYSTNGGKTWKVPNRPPHGYRSCVEFLSKKEILACGPTGIDYSEDEGKNWKWISKESFHVCRIARIGTTVYLAGANGKIGKIISWE
ncbi:MAG: YCF48-related protein [Chitinophagaceae bacterium]